jgi:hypothetical protein
LRSASPEADSHARRAERVRRHPRVLASEAGSAIVRGEVLALGADLRAIANARRLGFRVKSAFAAPDLGLAITVLEAPRGMSAEAGRRQLQALDARGVYDLNHLYAQAGGCGVRVGHAPPDRHVGRTGDGSPDRRGRERASSQPERRAHRPKPFAGRLAAGPHGLATASLLVGPPNAAVAAAVAALVRRGHLVVAASGNPSGRR